MIWADCMGRCKSRYHTIAATTTRLCLWCLAPLVTIFQLYRGAQFYWWRNRSKSPTCRKSLTNLSHNIISSTPCHERNSNATTRDKTEIDNYLKVIQPHMQNIYLYIQVISQKYISCIICPYLLYPKNMIEGLSVEPNIVEILNIFDQTF